MIEFNLHLKYIDWFITRHQRYIQTYSSTLSSSDRGGKKFHSWSILTDQIFNWEIGYYSAVFIRSMLVLN